MLGFFQQGKELRNSVEALQLQSDELKHQRKELYNSAKAQETLAKAALDEREFMQEARNVDTWARAQERQNEVALMLGTIHTKVELLQESHRRFASERGSDYRFRLPISFAELNVELAQAESSFEEINLPSELAETKIEIDTLIQLERLHSFLKKTELTLSEYLELLKNERELLRSRRR